MPAAPPDFERALVFLYVLAKGLPEKGSLVGKDAGETQKKVLAQITGWSVERVQAAFEELERKGFADKT